MNNNSRDPAAIAETCVSPDQSADLLNIPGFDLFSRTRTERSGGGVAIYTRHYLHATPLKVSVPDNQLVVCLRVRPSRLPDSEHIHCRSPSLSEKLISRGTVGSS